MIKLYRINLLISINLLFLEYLFLYREIMVFWENFEWLKMTFLLKHTKIKILYLRENWFNRRIFNAIKMWSNLYSVIKINKNRTILNASENNYLIVENVHKQTSISSWIKGCKYYLFLIINYIYCFKQILIFSWINLYQLHYLILQKIYICIEAVKFI